MPKPISTALARADRAIAGAGAVVLTTVAIAAASVPPDPMLAAAPMPAAKPAIVTEAPVELAMADIVAERRCLAEALYYEARGESYEGKKAVAEVVLQRVRDRFYPNTICGVVYEGSELKRGCQFSFTCNGDLKRAKNPRAWREARMLAGKILNGTVRLDGTTGKATHYHANFVQPRWADYLQKTVEIGNHIFYRRAPRERSG